ncbi:MAG: CopG family transcriptional regulator [Deltaproteobacteria bacterium]|nr:CopG family transcriptional regulator [Deltaproteobacteria bacterium]
MAQVKTSISIQEFIFKDAAVLARQMKISLSQLFALAVKKFIQEHRNRQLLERINKAFSDEPDPEEKKLLSKEKSYHRRMVERQW